MKQVGQTPGVARSYQKLALLRDARGDAKGAIAAYEQGLGVMKDDISLQIGMAGLKEKYGDIKGAIAIYEKVLGQQSDNALAINNYVSLLADHRKDKDSLKRAQELASKLSEIDQPAFRDTVAWVHYRSGEYAKAVELLKQVVDKAPNVAIFHYHLGMAYHNMGNAKLAGEHFMKVKELDGKFAWPDESKGIVGG